MPEENIPGIKILHGSGSDLSHGMEPDPLRRRLWEALIMISTFLSLLVSSFLASFDSTATTLVGVLYTCDVLYLIDTVNRVYHTLFEKETPGSKKNHVKASKKALLLDFISLLPLEIIAFAQKASGSWLHITRLHRLNRIARFYRIFSFFARCEDRLGTNTQMIRTIKHTFVAYVVIHLMACGWFVLSCDNKGVVNATCHQGTWAQGGEQGMVHPSRVPNGDVRFFTTLEKYLTCLYWSTITATSTGYGDIHAVNTNEKWYSVLCMIIGVLYFFGSILGDMGSSMTNSDQKRAGFKHKLNAVLQYLEHKQITKDLAKNVTSYYEHLWIQSHGISGTGLFNELPMTFQTELSLNVNRHVLDKAPMFKDTCAGFKRMLSMSIKSTTYSPGQIVFKENDIGHALYYIRRGAVEILCGKELKPIKSFEDGTFFGEISLVWNVPRAATARATCYTDILSLNRADLNNVIKHYPEAYDTLLVTIEERYQNAEKSRKNKININFKNEGNGKQRDLNIWKLIRVNLRKMLNEKIFLPESNFITKWRYLIFSLTVIFIVVHTWVASFEVSFNHVGYGQNAVLKAIFGLWYVYDLLLVVDILIGLRTAIIHDQRGLVKDQKEIVQFRLKMATLWIDILSVLPIEIFAFHFPVNKRWFAATFLKSNRLIRIYYIPQFFKRLEDNINNNIAKSRAVMLFLYLFLTTHLTGCLLYLQACVGESCSKSSWAGLSDVKEENHVAYHYIISVYWACATMTSTGYGDISAVSFRDEIFVLFVLVIGLLLYGFCLSSIAATLNNKVAPKTTFMEHIAVVLKFMKDNQISSHLAEEVHSYLQLIWRMHKGQSLPGARTLMDDMPISLQRAVAYDEMKQILQDVPIFKDTDEKFLKMVSLISKTFLFTPGDIIVHVGDMSRDLYIVRRGQAEILSADRSCVVATCGPGGYFGEVGLLYGESRPSDVRSKTYCEIVMVSKADLDTVLRHFPVISKQLVGLKENIEVLQRLKSTALKEAQRSFKQQEMISSLNLSTPRPKRVIEKPGRGGRIFPLTGENNRRKISLPTWLTSSISDKITTPEFRQQRMLIMDRHASKEYYKSLNPFFRALSSLLMRQTISPNGYFFQTWVFVSVAFAYIYLILIGFTMTFLHAEKGIVAVESVLDTFFLIDMYIKLHVSFYNEKGVIVSHPVETAKNYLRTNFIVDLLAIIPLNRMSHHTHSGLAIFGKANRILHIVKVAQFFSFFQTKIGRHANTIRHIALNSYLVVLVHYFACAWYLIACPQIFNHHHSVSTHQEEEEADYIDSGIIGQKIDIHHTHFKCGETSWVHKGAVIGIYHEPYTKQYIVCLYWAISTMCSVGYGDIHPYLSPERVLASVCMIFGVVFFGYIIATALALQSNADAQRSVYVERLEGIERFLMDQDISPSLELRVLNHYEYVWKRTRGVDMKNLFEGLPISIQGKISLSLYQSYIKSVPIFRGLESGIIKTLSLVIKPLYILKNEYIVRQGDIAQEIFFIHCGSVEVVSEDDEPQVLKTMTVGDFFGDINVVCSRPVDSSVRAMTNTNLLIISKVDLDNILDDFPQFKREIYKIAGEQTGGFQEEDELVGEGKVSDIEEEGSVDKHEECQESFDCIVSNNSNESPSNGIEGHISASFDAPYVVIPVGRFGRITGYLSAVYRRFTMWNRFVVEQNNPLRRIRHLNCVAIFATYLTMTYMAAYKDYSVPLIIFNHICELSFYVEIYLNFHMAYTTEDGETLNDFDKIFSHYLTGKFRYDVVTNFPLEIFALAFPSEMRMLAYSYLRLIHLLRIVRVVQLYNGWVTELNINVLLVRFSENIVYVALFVHTFACIWYVLSCPMAKCSPHGWVAVIYQEVIEQGKKMPPFRMYADSVYWAVATMTSTGYGDIHAFNIKEMMYASLVMIAGKVIFGFVLGKITSALANSEAHRVEYEDRLSVVQAHMRGQNISASLQKRVVDFFRYNWAKNRGLRVTSLLDDLPYCLHAEICYALIGDIISTMPMFRSCGMPFRRLLCTKAQFCHFYPGEFVMSDGDIGQGMYIVRRGKVESLSAESKEPIKFYSDGDFFGEDNIILNKPCSETMRTVTHVDLFLLTKSDIQGILQAFSEEAIVVGQNSRRLRRLSIIEEEC